MPLFLVLSLLLFDYFLTLRCLYGRYFVFLAGKLECWSMEMEECLMLVSEESFRVERDVNP